jgi:hypothetical protein
MPYRDWTTQTAICQAIMQGQADAAFLQYGVSLADQIVYRRMASEALAKVVAKRSTTKRYFKARIKNPIWISTALSSVIGLASFISAVVLCRWINLTEAATYPILGAIAGFSAIGVAAVGWGVSAWIAHRNNRSRYTLEIVAARFAQTAFTDALRGFNKYLRMRLINRSFVDQFAMSADDNERLAIQGLRYLLNYFEFISVGVLEGELDERIVDRTLRGNLVDIYDLSAPYIMELQRENPRTLQHFTILRRHYQDL